MEIITNRRLTKVFVGTIGGMVTIFLAPWAATFAFVGLTMLPAPHAIVQLVWGIAGLLGLCGFWAWTFSKLPLSKQKRAVLTALICSGLGAAIASIVQFGVADIIAFVCVIGTLTGLVSIVAMWLPNT